MIDIEKILRQGLAAFLIVAGGDVFLRFSSPPEPSVDAQEFLISLTAAGYIWPTVGIVYLVSGVLLFFKKYAGLALVILMPVTANIVLYVFFVDRSFSNGKSGLALTALHLIVAVLNRGSFKSLIGK